MKKIIKILVGLLVAVAIAGIHAYGDWSVALYDRNVDSGLYTNIGEMTEHTLVRQEFVCPQNGLNAVNLRVALYSRENQTELNYRIVEKESGEVAVEGVIVPADLEDNDFNQFTFSPISDSKNKTYLLEIEDQGAPAGDGITVFTTNKNKDSQTLTVNDETSDQALVAKISMRYFNVEDFVVLLALFAYVVGFIKLLYRFLK